MEVVHWLPYCKNRTYLHNEDWNSRKKLGLTLHDSNEIRLGIVFCECGQELSKGSLTRHRTTLRHKARVRAKESDNKESNSDTDGSSSDSSEQNRSG